MKSIRSLNDVCNCVRMCDCVVQIVVSHIHLYIFETFVNTPNTCTNTQSDRLRAKKTAAAITTTIKSKFDRNREFI